MESVFINFVLWDWLREMGVSLVQWVCHKFLCECFYQKHEGERVPIPDFSEELNPLEVFEETHVEVNFGRWAAFVMWLQQHPTPWRWFRIIQKTHPSRVPSIFTLAYEIWHHERRSQ